jgi:1,4-dihydroxy-2-naphthoate octaprenyltransferase
MRRFSLWWVATRPFSFSMSAIPPILGALIAALDDDALPLNWFHLFLTLLGCVLAHGAANLLGDYCDFRNRLDRDGTYGSSGLLVAKSLSPREVLHEAIVLYSVAGLIGAYLVLAIPGGAFLLALILMGGALGVFYTVGPVALKYRALGDVAVFISFGSAMTLGSYYVQAHHFSWDPVLYALPIAFLVDAVLHSNNLRDVQNDRVIRIKTVPLLIGERNAKLMYYGLVFGAYVSIPILVAFAGLPEISLITLLSVPIALKGIKMVRDKNSMPNHQFAFIDAATAQLHLAFGSLLVLAFLVQTLVLL